MSNSIKPIAQTFTFVTTTIEGENFDTAKASPNFVRAYQKVESDSRNKDREIVNAVEAAFPTDFSDIKTMFASRVDQEAKDQFEAELKAAAKAEGFDYEMTQGYPNYVHVTTTPIGRITRKTIASDVVFNPMHDGAGVSREEITVEIFGDENTPFPVMRVDPRGKIGRVSINRGVGIASEPGSDDDDILTPSKEYFYDEIVVTLHKKNGEEERLLHLDRRFNSVGNFGADKLVEKFEQIRLDQKFLWYGAHSYAGGRVVDLTHYHAETLASDYAEQLTAMLTSPWLLDGENEERIEQVLEVIRNA